jgi:hypothetical protein
MRKWSLTVAVLLLAGIFLPNVAKASDGNLLLQILSPAPATTLSGGADCKADVSAGAHGAFVTSGNNCGSCSDRFCQGSAIGNACPQGGLGYTCQVPYGLECPSDPTKWQCICWAPGVPFP